jgi:hypothetical protein
MCPRKGPPSKESDKIYKGTDEYNELLWNMELLQQEEMPDLDITEKGFFRTYDNKIIHPVGSNCRTDIWLCFGNNKHPYFNKGYKNNTILTHFKNYGKDFVFDKGVVSFELRGSSGLVESYKSKLYVKEKKQVHYIFTLLKTDKTKGILNLFEKLSDEIDKTETHKILQYIIYNNSLSFKDSVRYGK